MIGLRHSIAATMPGWGSHTRRGPDQAICYNDGMLDTVLTAIDWFGTAVFAVTGALVASRKRMDIVGFVLLGCVTGIGGGSLRDADAR